MGQGTFWCIFGRQDLCVDCHHIIYSILLLCNYFQLPFKKSFNRWTINSLPLIFSTFLNNCLFKQCSYAKINCYFYYHYYTLASCVCLQASSRSLSLTCLGIYGKGQRSTSLELNRHVTRAAELWPELRPVRVWLQASSMSLGVILKRDLRQRSKVNKSTSDQTQGTCGWFTTLLSDG